MSSHLAASELDRRLRENAKGKLCTFSSRQVSKANNSLMHPLLSQERGSLFFLNIRENACTTAVALATRD